MQQYLPDIRNALREKILVDNPNHNDDQRLVQAFITLVGRPSLPIDEKPNIRTLEDFQRVRTMLPGDFFDPFNELLKLVGMDSIDVAPDRGIIDRWNHKEFVPEVMKRASNLLDQGRSPRLIPTLVWVFLNLEREQIPEEVEWPSITAISIPGSRTYDRAAEAFRAYIHTGGRAVLITSGKAPYYDPNNSDYHVAESEANAAYLRLLGVPPERIYTESQSQDTIENADFLSLALELAGQRFGYTKHKLMLVTSPFHLARYRFNVELSLRGWEGNGVDIFAVGSKASRYWAETYFLVDTKSVYTREGTMQVVFNEYLKIAYDMCTCREAVGSTVKAQARR